MSKVLTFSRYFPAYHPKAGQPTFFVEKIWDSIGFKYKAASISKRPILERLNDDLPITTIQNFTREIDDSVTESKHHTIRAGHRFKAGDKFSPRVWSGKPYRSKQIIIAPDIEVVKTWDFEMIGINWDTEYSEIMMSIDGQERMNPVLLATNDGLTYDDFYRWFTLSADFKKTKVFSGQIICWNENINY